MSPPRRLRLAVRAASPVHTVHVWRRGWVVLVAAVGALVETLHMEAVVAPYAVVGTADKVGRFR